MSEDVMQIGEKLKDKRKELNLSIKEVENSTSIRSNYIEAIEEGREDQFLSPVYMLGFLRQYANFLGLDGDQMIRENPSVFGNLSKKQDFPHGIGTLEVRGSLSGGVKWLPNLIWAMIFVVVLVLAYYLAKYLDLI